VTAADLTLIFLVLSQYEEIWVVDFEFISKLGQRPDVVCLVGRELRTKRTIRTTAGRLGESTQLLNIPFEPIYKALSVGVGLYAAVLIVEVFVLARRGQLPLLIDESRAMGSPE
jgi:hypothetical protein